MLLKSEDSHVIVQSPDTGHVLKTSVRSKSSRKFSSQQLHYMRYIGTWLSGHSINTVYIFRTLISYQTRPVTDIETGVAHNM